MNRDLSLLRALQLASPSLPVGAYAYSQGLEWAVAAGWVVDEEGLKRWLEDQLSHTIAGVDLPILARLYCAAQAGDDKAMVSWSRELIALRETRELVADDCARGRALARLLRDLGNQTAVDWVERPDVPFAAMLSVAAVDWGVPLPTIAQVYAWSWLENQVLAGIKLVPLGQVCGQRLLRDSADRIAAACEDGLARGDDQIGGMLPIVALASSLHETQYTRLFRS
ncbi:MAG TPA: urease accessory protein UreF [Terriglobales bacterium]|nr:urease accessory protein UreF [Terriglobales bacterium]